MGTVVSFDLRPRGRAREQTEAALAKACAFLHRADDVFSLYRPDTPLSRLRRHELALRECPPEVARVLALCEVARDCSGGWFDPWAMPGGLDPTGLVKGWAAREAAAILAAAGIRAGMVNAAGDIAVFGGPLPTRRWRVGVRSPAAPDDILCVVEAEAAVATSGSYERGEHVLDVRSGEAATTAVSASVCGPDLAFADALATGLLAAGEAGFAAVLAAGFEALVVAADGEVSRTSDFPIVS